MTTLLLTALSALAPALVQADAAEPRPVPAERLVEHLERLASHGFSGVAYVERDGEALVDRGFGLADRESGAPNRPGTPYPLGSISKHFTAAAVLRLWREGVLELEDTLDLFFEGAPPDKQAITLDQLLTHCSGLPAFAGSAMDATSADELVAAVLAAELDFPPGAGQQYSNLGFGLLAAIVERVTERPFDEVERELVLAPAGMTSSGFEELAEKHALPHGYIDDRDTGTLFDEFGGRLPWHTRGAGGLLASAYDMARWSRGLRVHTVLDAEAFARMTTPVGGSGRGFAMGYGCGIEDTPLGRRIGHSGSNDVFSAHFHHYLERDLFVFVACNDADFYADGVIEDLAGLLAGQDVPAPPLALATTAEEAAGFAGTYELAEGQRVLVDAKPNGALRLSSADRRPAVLLNPVHLAQVVRRDALLDDLALAYAAAFEGELEELHDLVDPSVPLEAFVGREAAQLDAWTSDLGAFTDARCFSGRNRWGEIAIVVELSFERGLRRIEYSFGQNELGSIRLLADAPRRVVRRIGVDTFADYDAEARSAWILRFELDAAGHPTALLLTDEGGREARLARLPG